MVIKCQNTVEKIPKFVRKLPSTSKGTFLVPTNKDWPTGDNFCMSQNERRENIVDSGFSYSEFYQRPPIQKLIANCWYIYCINNTEIDFPLEEEELRTGNF